MNKRIVFCGGGNMAEGIIKSLLNKGAATVDKVMVKELSPQRCDYLAATYGVSAHPSANDALKEADMVIIAVLPQHVQSVTTEVKSLINEKAIVMSIAAGTTIKTLEDQLGNLRKIVRVMPNTLSQSGNGHSAACVNTNIDETDRAFITQILDALGQTMYINEEMFNTFTAFSCSGPLWIYQAAEALMDAGVYVGFSRADARNIVIKNMLGVAQVLDTTGAHPKLKIDEMCSPGGITIEGFKSLQEEGFSANVLTSVCKAVQKANSIK